MKVIILNGNPNKDNIVFDNYLVELSGYLQKKNNPTQIFTLREMNIEQCIGCFNCWVKTPGECFSKDEARDICRVYINSDLAIFASPVIMGFTSAILKKINEKFIPLVHPYFGFYNGQVHHVKRYKKYPVIGLLLEKNNKTDQEDIDIISEIYKRDALELKTSFSFTKFINDPIGEIENEINSI